MQGDNKSIPEVSSWDLSPDSKFVHYCDNETIGGVEFRGAPDVGDKLLCGDFSSDFLSKPIDVGKYAVVYGGSSLFPLNPTECLHPVPGTCALQDHLAPVHRSLIHLYTFCLVQQLVEVHDYVWGELIRPHQAGLDKPFHQARLLLTGSGVPERNKANKDFIESEVSGSCRQIACGQRGGGVCRSAKEHRASRPCDRYRSRGSSGQPPRHLPHHV